MLKLFIAAMAYILIHSAVLFFLLILQPVYKPLKVTRSQMGASFLALALFKLWLVAAQTLWAIVAFHDDLLFVHHARSLLKGDWLGPYNELTLAKGPMYPIWIALNFCCGFPLLLSQHLLYIAACVTVIVALRPLVTNRIILITTYALLVFNPMTYTTGSLRVIREGIYPALTVLVIAGLIGLYSRLEGDFFRIGKWSVGLGIAFSTFWLTREEGLWIVPALMLLMGYNVWTLWRARSVDWIRRLGLCLLPFAIWGTTMLFIGTINKAKYGIFTTVDLKSHEFMAAYGALCRVEHAQWRRYIPVPKETRERIYQVSPAFNELQPYLEGEMGKGWAMPTTELAPEAPETIDILGGGFIWALRDAVVAAGYYSSGGSAMKYYSRLAAEINQACAKGALRCGPERVTLRPPWRAEYGPLWVRAMVQGYRNLIQFEGFSPELQISEGPENLLGVFRDTTRERLTPRDDDPLLLPAQALVSRLKLDTLEALGRLYQQIIPWSALVGCLAYLASAIIVLHSKQGSFLFVHNTALLGAIFTLLVIISFIDISAFPALHYTSGAYPLLLIFCTTSLADLINSHGRWSQERLTALDSSAIKTRCK